MVFCLLPAFWIAGAIGTFLSQQSVMRYLGPSAPKPVAYGVAAVSGTVLAVCSCTVLPLFAGIHRMGAGLGPATAFLYSGLESRTFWMTAILAPRFLASAFAAGPALLILLAALLPRPATGAVEPSPFVEIGRQDRPSLYDGSRTRAEPLASRAMRVGVPSRSLPDRPSAEPPPDLAGIARRVAASGSPCQVAMIEFWASTLTWK